MASLKAGHPDTPPLILHWPLLYANKELVGRGTLLTVSEREWQVAGTMPVQMGMGLKVWISPGHRDDALYVREARVLWAGANEFGLEPRHLDGKDHQWLLSFFRECGHSFRWLDVINPQLPGIATANVSTLEEEVQHEDIFVGKDASADERSRPNNHVP